jgi:hypothetical protein
MLEVDMGDAVKDKSLTELHQLQYDTTLDLYRRVAHAKMVAAYRDYYDAVGGQDLAYPDMEYYVYKLFGSDIIGSIAFALDPLWRIAKAPKGAFYDKDRKILESIRPVSVVPINRNITSEMVPRVSPVIIRENRLNVAESNSLRFVGGTWIIVPNPPIITKNSFVSAATGNVPVYGRRGDTTWKSRNPNAKVTGNEIRKRDSVLKSEGEFESFEPRLRNNPYKFSYKSLTYRFLQLQAVGHNLWGYTFTDETRTVEADNGAYIDDASLLTLKAAEHAYALAAMNKSFYSLFARCVPSRRYFNLGYQLGELKDITKTLRGTILQWRELQSAMGGAIEFGKALSDPSWWTVTKVDSLSRLLENVGVLHADKLLSDVYLNFKFGWQSTYQALVGLLKRPYQAANDVNRLIARNGKFSNLSATTSGSDQMTSPPALNIPPPPHYATLVPGSIATQGYRSYELRMVCNSGINFPSADVPRLRKALLASKLGLIPTPADLYDLVPWTWLVDWFTGASEYLHLMDNLSSDRSIINYGLLTYKSKLRVHTSCKFKYSEQFSERCNPPDPIGGGYSSTTDLYTDYRPYYEVKYILRLSLESVLSSAIKTYSGTNLSTYQKSVLGALFSKLA